MRSGKMNMILGKPRISCLSLMFLAAAALSSLCKMFWSFPHRVSVKRSGPSLTECLDVNVCWQEGGGRGVFGSEMKSWEEMSIQEASRVASSPAPGFRWDDLCHTVG